jgi:hypothetical protein
LQFFRFSQHGGNVLNTPQKRLRPLASELPTSSSEFSGFDLGDMPGPAAKFN